jgi:replicative DNA helicase
VRSGERVQDLISDLKKERAFLGVRSALDSIDDALDHDNALEKAGELREILFDVLRTHSPQSDTLIKSDWRSHLDKQKEKRALAELGQSTGITTGIEHFDVHLGGMQPSFLYVFLGRPGDAKSMVQAKIAVSGMLEGRRVGFFSPEMNEDQHRCRFSTLLSDDPEIQKACGLKGAFKNRALMDGVGFNIKKYGKFLEYVEQEVPGEILLFTQKFRKEKMTVSYIESKVEELGLEIVFVDPIYKLRPPKERLNKVEQLADVIDALQDMAKAFNIPVVCSNQAARHLVGNRGEAPSKDTSYGADAPVQEADAVIGVRNFSDENLMKVNCSKNRFGNNFRFEISFWPNIGKMVEVTKPHNPYKNGYDPEAADKLRKELEEAIK